MRPGAVGQSVHTQNGCELRAFLHWICQPWPLCIFRSNRAFYQVSYVSSLYRSLLDVTLSLLTAGLLLLCAASAREMPRLPSQWYRFALSFAPDRACCTTISHSISSSSVL